MFYTLIKTSLIGFVAMGLISCAGTSSDTPDDDTSVKISSTPGNKQESVSVNLTNIMITFDHAIDPASVEESNLNISPSINCTIDKSVLVSQNKVYFILQSALQDDTQYTASLSGVRDADGNPLSTYNWTFQTAAGAPAPDTEDPTAPGNLRTTNVSSTTVDLSWDSSTDNVAVALYTVFRNNSVIATLATGINSYSDTSVAPGNNYLYTVRATDLSNNFATSTVLNVYVPNNADTVAPTAPGNLRTNGTPTTSVALEWNASTDNVGVVSYRVLRGGNSIATLSPGTTDYTDSTVSPGNNYQYNVRAYDAAGNYATSSALNVNLPNIDTTAPTVTSTTPTHGATNVLPSLNQIVVNFDEEMDTSSLNTSSFTLDNGLTGTVSTSNGATRATFTPNGQLSRGTTYTATVNGATDAAGNSLQGSPFTWSFSTCGSTPNSTYTVSWNAVIDGDLSGYRLYYGTTSPLTKLNATAVDIGNVTSWIMNPSSLGFLPCDTVHVAVTAIGSTKGESALSNAANTLIE